MSTALVVALLTMFLLGYAAGRRRPIHQGRMWLFWALREPRMTRRRMWLLAGAVVVLDHGLAWRALKAGVRAKRGLPPEPVRRISTSEIFVRDTNSPREDAQ